MLLKLEKCIPISHVTLETVPKYANIERPTSSQLYASSQMSYIFILSRILMNPFIKFINWTESLKRLFRTCPIGMDVGSHRLAHSRKWLDFPITNSTNSVFGGSGRGLE